MIITSDNVRTRHHCMSTHLRRRSLTVWHALWCQGGIGPGNNYPLRGHKATPWCASLRRVHLAGQWGL